MLRPADQALVATDPALPGLRVLLDDAALGELLGEPVERVYLRYKPATSCVLAVRLRRPGGQVLAFLTAYAARARPKLVKTVRRAPRDTLLAVHPGLLLVGATAAADRDLPGLAELVSGGGRAALLERLLPAETGLRVEALRHKPSRRFVARVDAGPRPVGLLRAYRPEDYRPALRALGGDVLGADPGTCVLLTGWVPGTPLDALPVEDQVAGAQSAGRALAARHGTAATALPVWRAEPGKAAAAVGAVLPDLAPRARDLAEALRRPLRARPARPVALHGDLSADQVVVRPDGTAVLVDLDRAASGPAAVDLAAFRAAGLSEQLPSGAADALCAAYAELRDLPPEQEVALHTAGQLLQRVAEPFRRCRPDWDDQAARLLGAAEAELARAGA